MRQPRDANGRLGSMPLEERFWSKATKGLVNKCWEWEGGISKNGYGLLFNGKYMDGAHRISWKLHNGEIPDGLWVLHHCDNRPCVNPKHLFLGTQKDNMQDMLKKGRWGNKIFCGEEHYNHKVTNKEVLSIRKQHKTTDITQTDLAKQYKVSIANINKIVHRIIWKHI